MCGASPAQPDDDGYDDEVTCTKDGSQPQFGQCTAEPNDCADATYEAAMGYAAP